MSQTVHCRECQGIGRVSRGYDSEYSVVCLSCRGTGIVDVTQEQLDEWAREQARRQERVRAFQEAESRKYRKWDRLLILGIVGIFALVGGVLGNFLIGAGIGLIIVVAMWFAGE